MLLPLSQRHPQSPGGKPRKVSYIVLIISVLLRAALQHKVPLMSKFPIASSHAVNASAPKPAAICKPKKRVSSPHALLHCQRPVVAAEQVDEMVVKVTLNIMP